MIEKCISKNSLTTSFMNNINLHDCPNKTSCRNCMLRNIRKAGVVDVILSFAHCTSQQLFLVTQLRIVWALHFLSVKKRTINLLFPYKHQLFTNLLCRVVVRSSHKWMHEPMVESDFSQTMYNLFKRTSTCCKVVFCKEWRLGAFLGFSSRI